MRWVGSSELVDRVVAAIRQPDRRVHVVCAPEGSLALDRLVAMMRLGPLFDTPYLERDRGWGERTDELIGWRKAVGVETPRPGQRPSTTPDGQTPASRELRAFAELVRISAEAGPRTALGFAPRVIEDVSGYQAELASLLEIDVDRRLGWLFLDAGRSSLEVDLLERFGIETVGWLGGPRAHQELVRAIEGQVAERGVLPPEMEEFVPDDAFLRRPEAARLREPLWQAHREMEMGVVDEAELLYTAVCAELLREGQPRDRVHAELGRARMLVAAGRTARGRRVVARQIDHARAEGMHDLLGDLYASLGGMHAAEKHFTDAHEAYREAATHSRDYERPLVTAECLRCAGHAALNGAQPHEGLRAWQDALEVLGLATPPARGRIEDDIVLTALLLADAFQKEARLASAAALRGHAGAIEERRPADSKS